MEPSRTSAEVMQNLVDRRENTPRTLFTLAQTNHLVRAFLDSWKVGDIEWYEMLQKLASELENACHRITESCQIKDDIAKTSLTSLPFPVLKKSLIPVFEKNTRLEEKQYKLIRAITEICFIYQGLKEIAIQKLQFSAPPLIVSDEAIEKLGIKRIEMPQDFKLFQEGNLRNNCS
ncbi:MAG: hypothetical protein V7L23_29800 [Nostoc sp.]|uniref:hypothetical protein n=1 Tax=Nostoc sp. TaxID=1180 RepID=UPI002FF0E49B